MQPKFFALNSRQLTTMKRQRITVGLNINHIWVKSPCVLGSFGHCDKKYRLTQVLCLRRQVIDRDGKGDTSWWDSILITFTVFKTRSCRTIARDFRAAQKRLTIFSLHWRLRFGTHHVCIVTSSRFPHTYGVSSQLLFFRIWRVYRTIVRLQSCIKATHDILASMTTFVLEQTKYVL